MDDNTFYSILDSKWDSYNLSYSKKRIYMRLAAYNYSDIQP